MDVTFVGRSCQRHKLSSHSEKHNFACDQCDFKTTHEFQLTRHKKRIHLKERTFVCDICSKCFFDNYTLKNHLKTHVQHEDDTDSKVTDCGVTCETCGKKVTRSMFKDHCYHEHPTEENIAAIEAKCDKCQRTFENATMLNDHLVICESSNKKSLKCEQCAGGSSIVWHSSIALRKHLAETHKMLKSVCDICGALFSFFHTLKQHEKRVHHVESKVQKLSWKKWLEKEKS